MRIRSTLLVLATLLLTGAVAAWQPPVPPPSIESVVPSIGRPEGGQVVRITGRDLAHSPVRVFFEAGEEKIEVPLISVQPTAIEIVTPPVLLVKGTQRLVATLHVVLNAGTDWEVRITSERAFTFQKETLTPHVVVVTPNLVHASGGMRLTILGEGFQAPVMVTVEQHGQRREARVLMVDYSQIVVELPAGSGGAADLIVRNINGGGESRLVNAFEYIPGLQIASISPALGPATGGTRVRINGSGFLAPVAVTIGNVPAVVLSVTPTEIIAITRASACNADGPVQVIVLQTGETTTGPVFELRCPRRRAA